MVERTVVPGDHVAQLAAESYGARSFTCRVGVSGPLLYATDHCRALDRVLSQGKLGSTYCIGGARGFCGEAARLSVLQEAGLPELLQP